jgi:hypothetical protein
MGKKATITTVRRFIINSDIHVTINVMSTASDTLYAQAICGKWFRKISGNGGCLCWSGAFSDKDYLI